MRRCPQTRNLTLSCEAHSSSFYVYVTGCTLHEYENLCYLRNTHFIFWDGHCMLRLISVIVIGCSLSCYNTMKLQYLFHFRQFTLANLVRAHNNLSTSGVYTQLCTLLYSHLMPCDLMPWNRESFIPEFLILYFLLAITLCMGSRF